MSSFWRVRRAEVDLNLGPSVYQPYCWAKPAQNDDLDSWACVFLPLTKKQNVLCSITSLLLFSLMHRLKPISKGLLLCCVKSNVYLIFTAAVQDEGEWGSIPDASGYSVGPWHAERKQLSRSCVYQAAWPWPRHWNHKVVSASETSDDEQ